MAKEKTFAELIGEFRALKDEDTHIFIAGGMKGPANVEAPALVIMASPDTVRMLMEINARVLTETRDMGLSGIMFSYATTPQSLDVEIVDAAMSEVTKRAGKKVIARLPDDDDGWPMRDVSDYAERWPSDVTASKYEIVMDGFTVEFRCHDMALGYVFTRSFNKEDMAAFLAEAMVASAEAEAKHEDNTKKPGM